MTTFRTHSIRGPLMRVSYAFGLFTPREQVRDNGERKQQYGCTLIMPKDPAAAWQPLIDLVRQAAKGGFGGDEGLEKLKKGLLHNPILPGDGPQAHDKEGNPRAGLGPDVMFIRPISYIKPQVVDARIVPITDPNKCPSGWWGYPVLNAFSWDTSQKRGISFGISHFQLIKADEELGGSGRRDPSEYFEQVHVEQSEEGATKPTSAASMFD